MSAIHGRVKNGKIELPAPADWPDGTEVEVRPVEEMVGLTEEDWPATPEAIEEWVAWLSSLQPFVMTPEEEARWQDARRAQKEFQISKFKDHAEKLRKMWE
jgi:hypothetical protein